MKKIMTTVVVYSFTLLTSQEMEIISSLKVGGNIDVSGNTITNMGAPQAVADALNLQTFNDLMIDDRIYEYHMFGVNPHGLSDCNNPWTMRCKLVGEDGCSGFMENGWINYLNNLSQKGWKVFHINNQLSYSNWTL